MARLRIVWFLTALAAGCTGRTEIVVGVATDLKARGQVDLVKFVASRNGTPIVQHEWMLSDVPAGIYELPGSFGLYSADGSEPRVELQVLGYKGKSLVTERDSILSLISGQTLFMRMALVSDCSSLSGPSCSANESCIEGVCRARDVNSRRLPQYRKELVGSMACDSGTKFIVSSTGNPMPLLAGGCAANEFCQEGTCYKLLSGDDAGVSPALWTQLATPSTYVLHGLWGTADGADVFAVGDKGTLLHLAGAGPHAAAAWVDEAVDRTEDLLGVWGTSANDVYAVGTHGIILHRSNGAWHPESLAVEKLGGVWGSGPDDVWVVGRNADKSGVIAHKSGGQWTMAAGGASELRAVAGSSATDVWAVGPRFAVRRFAGDLFAPVTPPSGLMTDLDAVWSSGSDVYLAGRAGTVVHGTPSLAPSLTIESLPTSFDLFAAWGSAADDVYVAGDYGVIVHLSAGGAWKIEPSGTTQPIYALWGSGPSDVYAAGRDGVILHSTGTGGGVADLGMPIMDANFDLLDLTPAPPDLTPVVYVKVHYNQPDGAVSIDFDPPVLDIAVGTTVIWTWPAGSLDNDGGFDGEHTVTSCDSVGSGTGSCFLRQSNGQFCSNYPGPSPSPGPSACNPIPSPGPFTYSRRFDTPGSFSYFCGQHYQMFSNTVLGQINVK